MRKRLAIASVVLLVRSPEAPNSRRFLGPGRPAVRTGFAAGAASLGAAGGVLGGGAARAIAARIGRNPDPLPRERLTAEPEGEHVLITRPDGTVLHMLIA